LKEPCLQGWRSIRKRVQRLWREEGVRVLRRPHCTARFDWLAELIEQAASEVMSVTH
jgi:transposase InsO family protein